MRKNISGFTLIELLVAIAILGILATIGITSFTAIQTDARDSQRSSRITVLSEALEKYYDKNGAYPTCAEMMQTPSTVATNTLVGLDPETLSSPSAAKGTNSIASCSGNPATDVYIYEGGGAQYTLKYLEESTGTVKSTNSRRPNTVSGPPNPVAPTVSAATGDTTTFSWNKTACSVYLARYQYQYTVSPQGYDSGLITTTSTSISFDTSTYEQTYSITVKTQCYDSQLSSSWSSNGTSSWKKTNWYDGVGALAGKYIYKYDSPSLAWKTANSSCVSPQCAVGLDSSYPSNYALVASNAVDFSAYPARNDCKTKGGRLPTTSEAIQINDNAASYGANVGAYLHTSTERSSATSYQEYRTVSTLGAISYGNKTAVQPVRCIK